MPVFHRLGELDVLPIWAGVVARAVETDGATLSVVELDPGVHIPEHSHANEQLGVLVSGSLAFRAGAETVEAAPGTVWAIPGGVPHEVTAGPDGAVVVEVFAPRRDDWAAAERTQPARPRWP